MLSQVDIGYIVCIPSSALQAERCLIFCRFGRLGICTLAYHSMFCLNGGFDSRPWQFRGQFWDTVVGT